MYGHNWCSRHIHAQRHTLCYFQATKFPIFHWSLLKLYIKIDAFAQFIPVILKGYSGIYKIQAELI